MCACIQLMSDLPGPLKKFFYKFCFNKTGVQTMIWMAGGKHNRRLAVGD
jgi:hypothetical protein